MPYPAETLARGAWRGTNAIPSWSWRGCEGKSAVVEVYSPWDVVELYLNDVSLGRAAVEDMRAVFTVLYQPGTLKAVAFDANGVEQDRVYLDSAAGTPHWVIQCELDRLHCWDIAFFPVSLEGENGMVESNADAPLELRVTGGRLLGFGSADPHTEAEFTTGRYPSYYGRALAAVEIGSGECVELALYSGKELLARERFAVTR